MATLPTGTADQYYVGFLRRVVEPGLKLPGRFRNLARSALRVFRLTDDLPAIRQYLGLNLDIFFFV